MSVTSFAAVNSNKVGTLLLLLGILLISHHDIHYQAKYSLFTHAKEIEATKEWQLIEGNDTIAAGMHVRMDMTTGEKWVKLMSDDDEDDSEDNHGDNKEFKDVHIKRNAGGSKSSVSLAVVEAGGDVKINKNNIDNDRVKTSENATNYDFEMMYRTLSKLPPKEIEAMGGLPELPDSKKDGSLSTAFEGRMLDIWKKRQAELLELELNFPEILKSRIAGIKEYLADPETQLESLNLDADLDDNVVTDIVSLLKDLEFQLSDIDMTRDFHTMGGWPLLVQLVSEEAHVPGNKTIHELSRSVVETKIRTVQSHAAWAIGTAVKNTEEFFPYAVEVVVVGNRKTTTAIDLLIDVFCEKYNDSSSWEIRTLLAKGIYAIGAILRGNHLAQIHVVKTDGFDRLGQKYRELSQEGFNSANTKLIQRLAGLSTYIVEDVSLNIELSEDKTDTDIIHSLTSSNFCDATCELFSSDIFIPVTVQETLVRAIGALGPHCQQSSCAVSDFRSIVETIQSDWQKNKDNFDEDHFQELLIVTRGALESLRGKVEKDE